MYGQPASEQHHGWGPSWQHRQTMLRSSDKPAMQRHWQVAREKQHYHCPDLKIPTFPDEIADKMLNKCTFINTNLACGEVWVASNRQQVKQIHLNISCDCISMTPKFCYHNIAKVFQSNIPDYTNSPVFPWLLQNSLTFPCFEKCGNHDKPTA